MAPPAFDFEAEFRERIQRFVADLQALVARAAIHAVRGVPVGVVPTATRRAARAPRRSNRALATTLLPKGAVVECDVPLSLEAYERHAIVRALAENGNSVARAAAALGQPTNTLYNRMSTIGLRRSELGGRGAHKPLPDFLRLDGPVSFEAYERRALERALAEANGDKRAAAKLLGMGQGTQY